MLIQRQPPGRPWRAPDGPHRSPPICFFPVIENIRPMNESRALTVAYVTAGAGGMFCGSCLHDNTLARALNRLPNVDCLLIPTYTPIRTDEEDVSLDRVFLGGVTVYLEQKIPLFRYAPGFMMRLLDQPWLIRWLASRAVGTNARDLGALTLSMLRGVSGHQRREVRRLCGWLANELRPDILNLSNLLIGGCIPELKRQLNIPVLVTLQGDDIFLESLPEPFRSQAIQEIGRLVPHVDAFLVNSRFYAEFMSDYLGIPADKFRIVPLGIDVLDFQSAAAHAAPDLASRPPTVGYLARLAPEKGLHVLVDAFLKLRGMPGAESVKLAVAGWLGEQHRPYADEQFARLQNAGLAHAYHYAGTVDRQQKVDFLRSIDVLSVPTTYRDPKGLFILEALASGVPVVQPAHGAFPELLEVTGGGKLVTPNNSHELAAALHALLIDGDARRALGQAGRKVVHHRFHADAMAAAVMNVIREFVRREA
jgi:glycosyltransferase involved in cell wall biosynthesis